MEFTRGDTAILKFQRKDINGKTIQTRANKIYFSLKKDINSEEILIKKKLDSGITFSEEDYYYRITINPEDTEELEYGSYFYDIEVIVNDYTKTIKKGYLTLTSECTCSCDRW